MPTPTNEFSYRSRSAALQRFKDEIFDLLVIGGGISGAAVARDAASRGLKVALVEKNDFASGTSSKSSKLIHGGLRYLENMEFHLVFEALAERALLLKTVPHLVRPLPFYLPVYKGDAHGKGILGLGLWLYDLLALFRTPGFHRSLSRKGLLKEIPFLKHEGLVGGFRYYDASMWDDVLAVQTLASAQEYGAAVANYVEAVEPIWESGLIAGFVVRDREKPEVAEPIRIRAYKTVVCAGPWTDQVGGALSPKWQPWLMPSKGVHLVFDFKRLPVPGAIVMSHPEDRRIVFVMPRPDLGAGVTIVGTTDGPTPPHPENATIEREDVAYLMALLHRYFPQQQLTTSDILSGYVGVRPLMGGGVGNTGDGSGAPENQAPTASEKLQKVSREHYIGHGPGKSVVVAGGKYTTSRKMAEEIVEFTLDDWAEQARTGSALAPYPKVQATQTLTPINPLATPQAIERARAQAREKGLSVPEELWSRYGADAIELVEQAAQGAKAGTVLPGFPALEAQLRYCLKHEMVIHLEDFYFRRVPLYLARADHGETVLERLAQVWAEVRGVDEAGTKKEVEQVRKALRRQSEWLKSLTEQAH